MKIRKRLVHVVRFVLVITLMFMLASLIFLDMLFDMLFFRTWLSDSVLFVLIMMVALTVASFVLFPTRVVLDRAGITVVYPLGRRRLVAYSTIREYKIDDLLLLVELIPREGKPLEFHYSGQELDAIKAILEVNGVRLSGEQQGNA